MQWIGLFLVLFTAAVHSRSYGIGDPLFGHRIIVSFADLCDHQLCLDFGDETDYTNNSNIDDDDTAAAAKRAIAQTPLRCQSGTATQLALAPGNSCTTQAGQDACISFLFNTTLDGASVGATVYTCGNCSFYQNLRYAANVNCCTSDLCQTVGPPASLASCGALLNESACTTREDCYWCGNSSFGVDLCQELPGGAIDVCWAVPLRVPASVCGYVACAPFSGVPYSAQTLTLPYLKAFGLPPMTSLGPRARAIALDARSRYNQTWVVNDTHDFCVTDATLRGWCGVDTWHAPGYCIVAESWPQDDTWGWIQNTTATAASTSLTTLFPAFCACPIAGRALYLPGRLLDNKPHYGPPCTVEHALLAFFIVLMIASVLLFIWVIHDTAALVIAVWQRKPGPAAHLSVRALAFARGLFKTPTFPPKVLMWCYFPIAITDQALFVTPPSDTTAATARGVLCFLAVILLLFSYGAAVFACIEILLKAKVFGTEWDSKALYWFKWFFFLSNGLFLVSANALVIVFAVYLKAVQDFAVQDLAQLTFYSQTTTVLAKAIMLMLLLTQAIMMLETAALLLIVSWYLRSLDHRVRAMKDVMGRVAGLWVAWFCGLPNLGLLAFITPVISWITTGSILSYWDTTYQTNVAYLWLIFGYYATDLLWIAAFAYAMRTRIEPGWWQSVFARLVGKETMMQQDSESDGESDGASNTSTLDSTATHSTFSINKERDE